MSPEAPARGAVVSLVVATVLSCGPGGAVDGPPIPDYTGWRLEEEATTYRPGTDLRFYALDLKSYANPRDPSDKVVELRRQDVLYIVYHYTFSRDGPQWTIYVDAGFADAPCGFLDPDGKPTGRYVRIDLACLQETERVDKRAQ
jgi:hypothetical protein